MYVYYVLLILYDAAIILFHCLVVHYPFRAWYNSYCTVMYNVTVRAIELIVIHFSIYNNYNGFFIFLFTKSIQMLDCH